MKPKTLVTAAIVVALAVSFLFIARSCRIGGKYAAMKQQYAGYRLIAEADHSLSLSRVAELNNSIVQKDEAIVALRGEVAAKQKKVTQLSTRLDELQNAEPVQPELESQPLVVSLRSQVSKLTEMFNLSQQTITLQSQGIAKYVGQIESYKQLVGEWEQNYNREHSLRVMSEGLTKQLEKQYKIVKLKGRVATIACTVAGAYIGYRLIK